MQEVNLLQTLVEKKKKKELQSSLGKPRREKRAWRKEEKEKKKNDKRETLKGSELPELTQQQIAPPISRWENLLQSNPIFFSFIQKKKKRREREKRQVWLCALAFKSSYMELLHMLFEPSFFFFSFPPPLSSLCAFPLRLTSTKTLHQQSIFEEAAMARVSVTASAAVHL